VGAHPAEPEEMVDPATLPPIESLGPDSDYAVFLKKGVPEALRIAALRKAWMSDPFIRDFRSPAIDYGWDFTTPDYSLRATDDVAKMLDRMFPPQGAPGEPTAEAAPANPAGESKAAEAVPAALTSPLNLPQNEAAAPGARPPQESRGAEPAMPRRKHGGALPDKAD
jgi:hypothetical protein